MKCLEIKEGEKCREHLDAEKADIELNNISSNVRLPGLGVNPNTVTVAGFGCGAYMANVMHVVYSKTIKGAGLIEGGPYM